MALIILLAFVIFVFCLSLHVVIWRVKRPSSSGQALFLIFILLPLFTALAHAYLTGLSPDAKLIWAGALLMHISLGAAYIMSYPAVEALSPSLLIIIRCHEAGAGGISPDEIKGLFADDLVFGPRINDLERSGLVKPSGKAFAISAKGRALVMPFLWLRRLLGLPEGRG